MMSIMLEMLVNNVAEVMAGGQHNATHRSNSHTKLSSRGPPKVILAGGHAAI